MGENDLLAINQLVSSGLVGFLALDVPEILGGLSCLVVGGCLRAGFWVVIIVLGWLA